MHHPLVLKARPRHSVIEPLESRIAPAKLFAVTSANHLISFDSATPSTITSDVTITGLGAGELIDGADIRPATGQLYALGITDNGAARTGQIYTINTTTGAATAVGVAFSAALSDTDSWGLDFNPAVDRIRIVDGLTGGNLRVNPNNGTLAATDTNLTAGSLIDGVAYDRTAGGTTTTTLYGLDHSNNHLVTIGGINGTPSPNGGGVIDVGALGIVATGAFNFDIEAVTGIARASAIVGGTTQLYTINLTTGAATAAGNIGTGLVPISALTTASTSLAVVGTAGNDTLLFTSTGYSLNGGPVISLPGLTTFSFLGLAGDDVVTVDFVNGDPGLTGSFTYIGGGDPGDRLAVAGTNTQNATWSPSTATSGSGTFAAGTGTYNYSGVTAGLNVSKLSSLTLLTGAGVDSFTLNNGTLSGTSSAVAHSLTFATTTSLNLNVGTNDVATEADTVAITSLSGTGLTNLTVNSGPGNDVLDIAATVTSLALPQAGGAFAWNAGAGTDTLSATADVSMTLSNTSLAYLAVGSLALSGVETANLTGGAGNNNITVTSWSGTGTYNGLAGTNSVTLTTGDDTFTVTGARAGSNSGIAFSNIDSVDALGGNDTIVLLAAGDTVSVTGPNTAVTSGITFSAIETMDLAGGVNAVTLTAGNDTFAVTGNRAGSGAGIAFTNLDSVNGLAGANTLNNTSGQVFAAATGIVAGVTTSNFGTVNTPLLSLTAGADTFTVTGANAGTFGGVTFTGVTSVDALAPLSPTLPGDTLINNSGQTYSAATNSVAGITAVSFETVNTAALSLTINPDTFTVTGANAGTFTGVAYTGVTTVDALAGNDTIVLLAAGDNVSVTGPNTAVTSGITFSAIETMDLAGGVNAVTLTAGNDTFAVTGNRAGSGAGIAFTNLDSVNGLAGANTLNNTSGQVFAAATGIVAGVTTSNFGTVNTPLLSLTAGADTFTVTGANAGTFGGVTYTGVTSVDALAPVSPTLPGDTLVNNSGQTYSAATNSVAGITAVSFETINTAALSLTINPDTFTVTGANTGTFAGVTYTGVTSVDALASNDTIVASQDADFVLSDSALVVGGISLGLTSFETANLTGGIGTNSFTVSGWTGTGTLDGLAGSDTIIAINEVDFTLTNTSLARTGRGTLTLAGIEVANLSGGVGANSFTVSGWTGTGTMDGLAGSDTIIAANDVDFTLTNTSLARTGLGTLTLAGIEVANLTGGIGANTFTVSGWTGTGTMDGLAGSDTIVAINDVNFTLTDTGLARTGLGTLTLAGIEVANLTGGIGANSFTVSGWTGTGTMDGLAGSDTIIAVNDVDFTLTDTSLARTGLGTLTLAGIEIANLTGGVSANSFTVSGWTGTGTMDGLAGSDTIIAVNDVNFTLTDTGLARTGRGALTLAGIEVANLTGGVGANNFTVSGWTGTGTMDGLAGSDTIIAVNDVNFTLTNTSLARTGLGTLTLAGIEVANLTGGAGANSFTVSGWTGTGTLDGMGGSDTAIAVNDVNFTLTDTSLARSGGQGTLTLASLEVANLTGGAGANSFAVSGWTGVGTLDGMGGSDTAIAVNDVNFVLTNTTLARSGGQGTLTLASLEAANLTGGAGANTLTVSGWTGGGSFTGGGNLDVIQLSKNGDVTLTDTLITTTDGLNMALSGIGQANLTILGAGGGNSFTVSGWTGIGSLNGRGAQADKVIAVNDLDFTLADGRLVRSGRGTLNLSNIEVANLTGGAGDNRFTVTGWTGRGAIVGSDGSDMILATKAKQFRLKNRLLYTTVDGMRLQLQSIEEASLSGGDNRNIFDARGFSGDLTVDALGGNDVIIGGIGTNRLKGGLGDDHYVLRGVSDMLTETGRGFDLIDYSLFSKSVKVNLGRQGSQNVNGPGNVLSLDGSFEYIAGSRFNDSLIGSAKNNVIFGGDGDDFINADPVPGLTGTNYLIGGGGTDTIVSGQGVDFIQQDGERPFVAIKFVTVPAASAPAFLAKAIGQASQRNAVPESLVRILAHSPGAAS